LTTDAPAIDNGREPRIVPRAEHNISRSLISQNAVKVLYRLHKAGYRACLVGGGVRDLLLGREPKDFDVATDARPEEVRALFRNARLIGRRFRLVHVHFHGEIIEVATFRGRPQAGREGELEMENGMILRDNVYGTLEEDAWRRDFTVNALYYDIADFSVIDYTGGLDDLEAGRLRLIGDPEARYREDPVRMLRAVRFAAKLGFRIEPSTEAPLFTLGHLLESVPPARLYEEVLKLFLTGHGVASFELLRHYGLFAHLFPATEEVLAHEEQGFPLTFLTQVLENTDQRLREDKPVTPIFLFAALLWEPVRRLAAEREAAGTSPVQALMDAGQAVVERAVRHVAIPRRISLPMRDIWILQDRLMRRQPSRLNRLLAHPRFRAAYDFFLIRARAGEVDEALAQWWTHFEAGDEETREAMRAELRATGGGERRRRRRRRRSRKHNESPTGEPPRSA